MNLGSIGLREADTLLDVGDYPTSHNYILCTASQHVPASISSALKDIDDFNGIKVAQMLSKVVKVFDKATRESFDDPDGDIAMDSESESVEPGSDPEEEEEPGDEYEEDDPPWYPQSPRHQTNPAISAIRPGDRLSVLAQNSRIRRDLLAAKKAGFRVGHLGALLNNGRDAFVTVSCRVAKLGISEEALQAWDLDPNQYFILVIRYTAGYQTLENLTADEIFGQKNIEIRVGVNQKYKIPISQAIDAFSQTKVKSKETQTNDLETSPIAEGEGLNPLFIGRTLEELMNIRLVVLLRYRFQKGLSWGGSEEFYNDHQGRALLNSDAIDPKYWVEDDSKLTNTLPDLVTADHLTQSEECSFPLLAMQFALRHLVRCTEFCLVCHCKVEADFEALKPYVCSKPLCLYQYMSLGFGPSIEHEIMSQPHVVDLLVSFCYSSAHNHKLSSFPVGMSLDVPSPWAMPGLTPPIKFDLSSVHPPSLHVNSLLGDQIDPIDPMQPFSTAVVNSPKSPKNRAKFDRANMELIFPPGEKTLHAGQWIYLIVPGIPEERMHCRVIEAMHPTVRLGVPVSRTPAAIDQILQRTVKDHRPESSASQHQFSFTSNRSGLTSALTPAATPPPSVLETSFPEAQFVVYDQKFDDLQQSEKQQSICILLDTLPSVRQMKDFMLSRNGKNTSLRAWSDRISPAALGVLRWIIASNRSCIIQVDNINGETGKSEERVSGMPQWMQFRFAQGAPDKEQRFVTSVRQEAKNSNHPTLFAWHGSPLYNWHGIVREGLHFQHTAHGRAFGNGVYHALDVSTSLGYCGLSRRHSYHPSEQQGVPIGDWPHSELKITDAVALNEIVNAPERYVSSNPHLVVSQLDWIQSRYLFVKCYKQGQMIQDNPPTQIYEQDPTWTPLGATRQKVIIPITAVSKSRRPITKTVKNGNKKAKVNTTAGLDDLVVLSDDTDVEDRAILFSDEEKSSSKSQPDVKGKALVDLTSEESYKTSKTDFVPGVLDHTTLPLLAPPAYATSMATRSLQRELNNTLQIQNSLPAHELGWYIDPNLVDNVYQWIVELHSFDAHLPLSKDLKAKDLKSVVLEIRFGKEYPISPPFVRVIRPRFVGFASGGGGHVTAGGALCMELLTNSGWSAVANIESVLLQVRLAISSTDPRPARLEPGPVRDYGVGEAVEAFIRACNAHGVSSRINSPRTQSVALLKIK
ncbi:hypothetical protein MMC29_005055 [Sticta canariensis]|nr:hypothetical protein [Sticta canariensis]